MIETHQIISEPKPSIIAVRTDSETVLTLGLSL
jgi:hypothetical protein